MSEVTETAAPAARRDCSIQARRAARLVKARREQRIVGLLNSGVSIPEIAAREGVTEKRMRAVVRDILARRMPEPPEQFLALQASRVNEALLVAYGAMSEGNLKAVDRVVKIVRELDRYHGLAVAERRSSASEPRLEAPAQTPLVIAAPPRARPEKAPQTAEMLENAPGPASHCRARSMTAPRPGQRPGPTAPPPPTSPQMAPEVLEILASAPERGAAPEGASRGDGLESRREASGEASPAVEAPPLSPPTAPERLASKETAPGNGAAPATLTQLERELASGLYAPPSIGPDGRTCFYYRATPNGVLAA